MKRSDIVRCSIIILLMSIVITPIKGQAKIERDKDTILILIDYDYFNCYLCAESVINVNRILPKENEKYNLLGILTYQYENTSKTESDYVRIIENKWRGICRSNSIHWPFIIDQDHIFEEMTRKGSYLIILNNSKGIIKKYRFPISKEKMLEIADYVTGMTSVIRENE